MSVKISTSDTLSSSGHLPSRSGVHELLVLCCFSIPYIQCIHIYSEISSNVARDRSALASHAPS